ncbi:RDD family protein [Hufsiella ginkgonis]|uniref:DUF4339 domain-containing protein n=1 Tax=Hufsiella ginkgonis TaxID=2695274 RepID=A0A7K1Y3Y5_9SPHI|nr:RDD family protein [Hufsiella ginkgonis]MXV17952.1 DUF4339 domain-containing protein [Hufsiella ginkgonis]
MKDWYIVVDGKPTGPHDLAELQTLNIRPGTFMKTTGMDDYKEAHEIPELRKLLGFKKIAVTPQYFATLDVRLLAVAIDYFVVATVSVAVALLLVILTDGKIMKALISISLPLLLLPVKIVYAAVMEGSQRQGTFGKSWLGLKVCDETGLPISTGRAFARNLAKLLSGLLLGIGYLTGFFDRRQQCLHDKMAGTLVVKERLV